MKKWYQSRGVWGGVIAIAATVLQVTQGVEIDLEEQSEVIDAILGGIAAFGGILAIIGRIGAKEKIV